MNSLQDLLPALAAALSRPGEPVQLVGLADQLPVSLGPGVTVYGLRRTLDYDRALTYFPPQHMAGVAEWRDHFRRHPNPFQPGDLVAAIVDTLVTPDGTVSWLVADASCSADRFTPVDLSAAQRAQLDRYVGTTAAVILRVRTRTGQQFCHGSAYQVEPDVLMVLSPTNPTPAEIAALPPNARVVLEGTVVRYWETTVRQLLYRGSTSLTDHTAAYLELATDDGRTYVVPSWRPFGRPLVYDQGVLANLKDRTILPGERVRWAVYVGADDYRGLHGRYAYPYLLVPNHRRLHNYNRLRAAVRAEIRAMESYVAMGRYPKARAVFAALRRRPLTHEEQSRIQAINREMPAPERSLCDHRSQANRLLSIWGVDVESLNRDQFLKFAYPICSGSRGRPPGSRSNSLSDLYGYLLADEGPFTKYETLALLRYSLRQRLNRLETAAAQHRDYAEDLSAAQHTLRHFSYVNLAAAVRELARALEYAVARGYYDQHPDRDHEPTCPLDLADLTATAATSLRDALYEYPHLGRYVDRPRLVEIQQQLATYPMAEQVTRALDAAIWRLDQHR